MADGEEGCEDLLIKKAILIADGEIHVPREVRLPVFPIRSSGGPTSTRPHFIVGKDDMRVKVAMGPEDRRFQLDPGGPGQGFDVLDRQEGRTFLHDVDIIPATLHAPDQAFINIEPECNLGCLFCSSNMDRPIDWSADRWVRLVADRYEKGGLEGVAVTSGNPHGLDHMVKRMVKVVSGISDSIPDVPIGVEPNAVPRKSLLQLREAGAEELKINVQTATEKVFNVLCPKLDRGSILEALEEGVSIFGPSKVASNLLIGVGEKDKEIVSCVRDLARMGVAVNLRVLRVNRANRTSLEEALGSDIGFRDPDRMVTLARAQRDVFNAHGVEPSSFGTMCHRCGCCDLTVGIDL